MFAIFFPSLRREAFTLPFINMPIYWYGILFALGFTVGAFCLYFLYKRLINREEEGDALYEKSKTFVEKVSLYIVIGASVGARLGHVFFYENLKYYLTHPYLILNVREGGLASHGAVIGIFLAMALFCYKEKFSWLLLLDLLVMPAAIAGFFIRLGNFINQEIIGTVTGRPWGVIFANNMEGLSLLPRHPVQLYEGFSCLGILAILLLVWHFSFRHLKEGMLGGLFLILLFTFRFFFEFLKESQNSGSFITESTLSIGQWLSIPFILLGIALVFFSSRNKELLAGKG